MRSQSFGEAAFWENVRWNAWLARVRAKPKRRGIRYYVKPDEVIKRVAEWGIKIDRRTLTNYVKWGLVTPPEYRSGGRGVGPIVEYGDSAPAEVIASYSLLHGPYRIKAKKLSEIREMALKIEREPSSCYKFFTGRMPGIDSTPVLCWLAEKNRVEANADPYSSIRIELTITPTKVEKKVVPIPDEPPDEFGVVWLHPDEVWVYEDVHPEVGKRLIAHLIG